MIREIEEKALKLRQTILNTAYKSGASHLGSMMSVVEILCALYYGEISGKPVMSFNVERPGALEQDCLVFGKGQATLTLYSILADLGYFENDELRHFGAKGAMLKGRPFGKVPGVFASTVGFGEGLGIALGVALSMKMDKRKNKVFAVLGDGELQCGSIWESALFAGSYKLDNLIAIVDNNRLQSDGLLLNTVDIGNLQHKFESFGFNVIQVSDGHDIAKILRALEKAFAVNRKPSLIWCHTVSSKGVGFAEDKVDYHNAVLSKSEIDLINEHYDR